jgi:hypothetical protein
MGFRCLFMRLSDPCQIRAVANNPLLGHVMIHVFDAFGPNTWSIRCKLLLIDCM